MNTTEHVKIAKNVATKTYIEEMQSLGKQRTLFSDVAASIAIDWIGRNIGTLPDKLEPAINQYHRGIFHSVDAFKLIEKVKDKIRSQNSDNWQWNIFLLMALTAYQSHLLLDSQTQMGIPDYQPLIKLIQSFNVKQIGYY